MIFLIKQIDTGFLQNVSPFRASTDCTHANKRYPQQETAPSSIHLFLQFHQTYARLFDIDHSTRPKSVLVGQILANLHHTVRALDLWHCEADVVGPARERVGNTAIGSIDIYNHLGDSRVKDSVVAQWRSLREK